MSKQALSSVDIVDWKPIAATAWKECSVRKLTKVEKVAVVIQAINEKLHPYRVADLITPMTQRETCGVLRTNMDLINSVLGTNYIYRGANYAKSGRGDFGRHGGGQSGRYHGPHILGD